MLLLNPHVFNQTVLFPRRMGKGAVTVLPMGKTRKDAILLDPSGCAHLYIFHKISQSHRGMKAGQYMKMVLYTVNSVEVALLPLDNAAYVPKEILAAAIIQPRAPLLRGKDDVVEDLRIC